MSKVQTAIDALDGCDEYSLRHHLSEVSILIEWYAEAQAGLAALREELATLQTKHDRTELALSGSMKALTRVDNMWKKRWLEKTGEPAVALVVDDEFKAMFEEIKSYRHRLTAAEQRNAELRVEVAKRDALLDELGCPLDEVSDLFESIAINAKRYEWLRDHMSAEDFPAEHPDWSVPSEFESSRIDSMVDAALKPTESGASEPQCLLCLDKKTVPGSTRGFVTDCPDCCGEEG